MSFREKARARAEEGVLFMIKWWVVLATWGLLQQTVVSDWLWLHQARIHNEQQAAQQQQQQQQPKPPQAP